MSIRDYLPLLVDIRTIIRTLRAVHGTRRPAGAERFVPGQAQRATDRIHPAGLTVRVAGIRAETPSTKTLSVKASSGSLPPFVPGQYVNLFVEVDGVQTSRPMSISAPPRGAVMELTIKRKEGGFVSGHLLDRLRVGDELQISGPEGDFHYHPVRDGNDLVFIAAGSGVTPFMGMIEDMLERWPGARIALLYGNRTAEEIIFHDRLWTLATRHPQLRVSFALSRPKGNWSGERGRIDLPMIRRFLDGESLCGKTFFICGPPQMEAAARLALEELAVHRGRIRIEPSGGLEDVTRAPGWPTGVKADQSFQVSIEGRPDLITAVAGEPLLSSLERAGIKVPALCRSGCCGACKTRVERGTVVRASRIGMRDSERAAGFVHACVSHPVSDLAIEVLPAWKPLAPSPRQPAPLVPEARPVLLTDPRPGKKWGRRALAASGLGLFLYLVVSSGVTPDLLSRVGLRGFGLILFISLLAALADTTAWSLALRHLCRPWLLHLLGLRTGGDALTGALPGGVILGEPFKALGLRRWLGVSLTDGVASLLTVKFGLGITQSLFVLGGLILIYPRLRDRSTELLGFAGAQHLSLAVIAGFMTMLVFLLVAVLRGRSFSALARGLSRLPIRRLSRWLRASRPRIVEIDEAFARVYRENRRQLPFIFLVLLGGWLAGSLESYVLLRALDQPVTLWNAFAIESVGSMFRLLFFVVPSGIGGQDASLLALFKLFDLPRAAAGAFVLIKRLKELCWIGVGFLMILVSRKNIRKVDLPVAQHLADPCAPTL